MTTSKVLVSIAALVVVMGFAMTCAIGKKANEEQGAKNRVPVLQQSVQEAVQASKDAQTAAQQAQASQQAVQAQLDQLKQEQAKAKPSTAPCTGSPDCPEKIGPGSISDVSAIPLEGTGQNDDVYLAFTFTENGGFTKRFYPVCTQQVVPAGKAVVLQYHWRQWESNLNMKRGCYQIDGYQTK